MIIGDNNSKLFCYMSEEDRPYEKEECPYPYTKEDEEIIHRIVKKYRVIEPEDGAKDEQSVLENPVYFQQD